MSDRLKKFDIEEGIGFWVLSTANLYERVANETLSQHGITYRQTQVLGTLAMHGDVIQTELAELIQVEPSTVVRLLDRMERDGWIQRISHPSDRRKKLIRATDRAIPIWETIHACGREIRKKAGYGLSGEQLEQLIGLLAHVHANLTDNLGSKVRFPVPQRDTLPS